MPLESRLLRQFAFQVLLLVLAGCTQQNLLQKFASQAEQDLARHYIDFLRQNRFEDIERVIDSSIGGPSLHGTLGKMAALIPAGEPTSVTLVGVNRMNTASATTLNLTFEYDFSGKWLTMNVAVKRQGGNTTIVGFNVNPEPASLEQQNKFTLTGRTSVQYIVFALTIVLPLLTIWSLVVCVRTKLKGRKWPWVLFILLGIGKFAVNWTTGQWAFAPLSIQLFSAGAFAPLYGPWTFAISIPLGALIFLLRRSHLGVNFIAGDQN
jgi:hypothetical protein